MAGLVSAVLMAALIVAAVSSPPKAQAAVPSRFVVLGDSANPVPPAHSKSLGPLSPAADLRVDVTLRLPHPSAVGAFIASLSNRRSSNFDRFLRPGQFGQIFGPPSSEISAVEGVLRSLGLHPKGATSDRLLIPVTASAGEIDRAFHVQLVRYRLPSGACGVHDAVAAEHRVVSGTRYRRTRWTERSHPAPRFSCPLCCPPQDRTTARRPGRGRGETEDCRADTVPRRSKRGE